MALSNSDTLSLLTKANAFGVAIVTGAALGMYVFAIPIIITGRHHSSLVMLRQFHHLIQLGAKYMQTASRTQAGLLGVNAILLYLQPEPTSSKRAAWVFAAMLLYVQTAWYEIVFIFPTNDRLIEMEGLLSRADEKEDARVKPEVLRLLDKWRWWHIGRIVLPGLTCALVLYGGVA